MENTVTMNLKDYENLIRENVELKTILKSLKKKAEEEVEDKIRDCEINRLNSNQCKDFLNSKDEQKLLKTFTSGYDWTWRDIAAKCYVFVEQDVKKIALEKIARALMDRLSDALYEEENSKTNDEKQ